MAESMRVVVEVLADDRDDAVRLLRDAATLLKKSKPGNGSQERSFCLGDYRITVENDPDAPETRGVGDG